MNKQENKEPNNQQPLIEDLTVNEKQADETKIGQSSLITPSGVFVDSTGTLW